MALLSRDQIFAAPDRRFVELEVQEWGGSVRLASLTAEQVIAYAAAPAEQRMVWLLAAALVDAAGNPVFTLEDIPALGKKAPEAVLRVYREATKLNVLTPEAAEEKRGN